MTALCDEAQRSLDLANGPLLRALLVSLDDGTQRLLLAVHHLAVDGVSWRVLLEDLQQAYAQLAAGSAATLPDKTSAYQAWAGHLQAHARTLDQQLPYWQAQHADARDLPCENPLGSLQHRHGHKIESKLDAGLTRQLLQTGAGGLSHPGQRPVADGAGAGDLPLERAALDADPARRPWP